MKKLKNTAIVTVLTSAIALSLAVFPMASETQNGNTGKPQTVEAGVGDDTVAPAEQGDKNTQAESLEKKKEEYRTYFKTEHDKGFLSEQEYKAAIEEINKATDLATLETVYAKHKKIADSHHTATPENKNTTTETPKVTPDTTKVEKKDTTKVEDKDTTKVEKKDTGSQTDTPIAPPRNEVRKDKPTEPQVKKKDVETQTPNGTIRPVKKWSGKYYTPLEAERYNVHGVQILRLQLDGTNLGAVIAADIVQEDEIASVFRIAPLTFQDQDGQEWVLARVQENQARVALDARYFSGGNQFVKAYYVKAGDKLALVAGEKENLAAKGFEKQGQVGKTGEAAGMVSGLGALMSLAGIALKARKFN